MRLWITWPIAVDVRTVLRIDNVESAKSRESKQFRGDPRVRNESNCVRTVISSGDCAWRVVYYDLRVPTYICSRYKVASNAAIIARSLQLTVNSFSGMVLNRSRQQLEFCSVHFVGVVECQRVAPLFLFSFVHCFLILLPIYYCLIAKDQNNYIGLEFSTRFNFNINLYREELKLDILSF